MSEAKMAFEAMFGETLDALDDLIPGKPARDMLGDIEDDKRIIEYAGEYYELVPIDASVAVKLDEYSRLEAERDNYKRLYHIELKDHVKTIKELDKAHKRIEYLEAETDRIGADARKVFKTNARLRAQLNQQAVDRIDGHKGCSHE